MELGLEAKLTIYKWELRFWARDKNQNQALLQTKATVLPLTLKSYQGEWGDSGYGKTDARVG